LFNTSCPLGTNINTKTGTDFGSTNGIGYFENVNPNFPFQRGIVLTTGNASNSAGPNSSTLSDGSLAWTGDTDLQSNLLSQSGVIFNQSVNATSLEFDFIAKVTSFNFNFVFASEEYGASQCSYSDAFAFLLKDVTAGTAYTNLAVLPSTNVPISVATIRDNQFNGNCASVNPDKFAAFYSQSNLATVPINFNGMTIPLQAPATGLILNHTYHIKLVIADGNNNVDYDSAIFLQANSFDIGQLVLGPDTAPVCLLSTYPILNTNHGTPLNPATTFSWYSGQGIGNPITGQTSSTLDLNSPGINLVAGDNYFTVFYAEPGCTGNTDEIKVTILDNLSPVPVPLKYICQVPGVTNYNVDLNVAKTYLMAGNGTPLPASTTITFYSNFADASLNTPPAPISLNQVINSLSPPTAVTYYARISNGSCFVVRLVKYTVVPPPVIATQPSDASLCARNTTDPTPKATFMLLPLATAAMGTVAQNDPQYCNASVYGSLLDATNGTNPLPSAYLTATTTVYVRVTNNTDNGCYVVSGPIQLTVKPLPLVDFLPDVVVCGGYSLPNLPLTSNPAYVGEIYNSLSTGLGTTYPNSANINVDSTIWITNASANGCKNSRSFKVTIADLSSIPPVSQTICQNSTFLLPALPYGKYYTQQGGADNLTNTVVPANTQVNNTTTYWIWFKDTSVTPACIQERSFTITVKPFTNLQQSDYPNQFSCTAYVLPALPTDPNATFTYYAGPNKTGGVLNVSTPINTNQTIYVVKEATATPFCISEVSFNVIIGISNAPQSVISCSTYILPALTAGQYRTAPSSIIAGVETPGGSQITDLTPINATTTIYYYVPGQSCTFNYSFTVTVLISPLPPLVNPTAICDLYQLPVVNHAGSYFTGALGTGTSYNGNQYLYTDGTTNPRTIYFYNTVPAPPAISPCYVQDSFTISIYKTPLLDSNSPILPPVCIDPVNGILGYTVLTPVNGHNYQYQGGLSNPLNNNSNWDGHLITTDGLTTIWINNTPALPNYCVNEYSYQAVVVNTQIDPVNYSGQAANRYSCGPYTLPAIVGTNGVYYGLAGGPTTIGQITLAAGDVIFASQPVYIYSENNTRVTCHDEHSFAVHILAAPTALIDPTAATSICSNTVVSIPLSTPSNTTNSYSWTVSTNANITGAANGTANGATATISQTLINTTEVPQSITYTITPIYTENASTPPTICTGTPITTTITVNPAPKVANQTVTICTGTAFTVSPLNAAPITIVPAGTTYTWTVVDNTNVTGDVNESTPQTTISQTLTNSTLAVQTVVYTVTPTSGTTGTCAGATFTVTVNVNPSPNAIGTPSTPTICSGSTTNIILTSGATGGTTSYAWVTTANTNITGGNSGTGNSIADTLTNIDTLGQPQNLIYTITPTFSNNAITCVGTDLNLTVTVNPKPVMTTSLPDQTLCSNTATNLVTFSSVSPSVSYAWTAVQPAGITGVTTAGTSSIPVQTLVNSTVNPIAVTYTITPSTTIGQTCAGTPFVYTITVNPIPVVVANIPNQTLCSGATSSPVSLSSTTTNVTYAWTASAPAQITGYTASGATNVINAQTLTNIDPLNVYSVVYTATASTTGVATCTSTPLTYTITVNNVPVLNPTDYATVNACNSYTLPSLTVGNYFTSIGGVGPIPNATIYTDATTTIYVYAASGTTPNCPVQQPLTINVFNVSEPQSVTDCGHHQLPTLTNGAYYNSPGGVSPITNTDISVSQPVYVYGLNPVSGCSDEYSFVVTIIYQPNIFNVPVAMRTLCDTDGTNDGITAFNLTSMNTTLLGPSQIETTQGGTFQVKYYPTKADAEATPPTNEIVGPTTLLQTVWVRIDDLSVANACFIDQAINIIVNPLPIPSPQTPVLNPVICFDVAGVVATPITLNANLQPTANFMYTWSNAVPTVIGHSATQSVSAPGTYTVVAQSNITGCISDPAPVTVIQSQPAQVTYTATTAFSDNQSIEVIATGTGGNYEYQLDGGAWQDSPLFSDLNYGDHTIIVRDKNGCGPNSPLNVTVINYPRYFTPNKDQWQPYWNIIGIDKFTDAKVYIYDRYGKMIKQLTQNSTGWDGTYNNVDLPATDYWFAIYYTEQGESKVYKSHFSLIR